MLPVFGLASVPAWATPWASLVITSLLIPSARWARLALAGRPRGCLHTFCMHLLSLCCVVTY